MNKLQQLVVIKIEKDSGFYVCGYYNNIDDAETYINEVKISVIKNFQSQYAGEYIIVPCFYFNIV
jgi:hypothetical protein